MPTVLDTKWLQLGGSRGALDARRRPLRSERSGPDRRPSPAVRQGERVALYFASANFDEQVFDDPKRFDIGRSPNPHVTFGGGGSHYCIGANLSRLELKVMFDVIADELSETTL